MPRPSRWSRTLAPVEGHTQVAVQVSDAGCCRRARTIRRILLEVDDNSSKPPLAVCAGAAAPRTLTRAIAPNRTVDRLTMTPPTRRHQVPVRRLAEASTGGGRTDATHPQPPNRPGTPGRPPPSHAGEPQERHPRSRLHATAGTTRSTGRAEPAPHRSPSDDLTPGGGAMHPGQQCHPWLVPDTADTVASMAAFHGALAAGNDPAECVPAHADSLPAAAYMAFGA